MLNRGDCMDMFDCNNFEYDNRLIKSKKQKEMAECVVLIYNNVIWSDLRWNKTTEPSRHLQWPHSPKMMACTWNTWKALCVQMDFGKMSCTKERASIFQIYDWLKDWFTSMVIDATFNNISVILVRSLLLVEETGVPGENHRPVESHWQTFIT